MFADQKDSWVTDEPSHKVKNGFKTFIKRRELIIGTQLADMQRVWVVKKRQKVIGVDCCWREASEKHIEENRAVVVKSLAEEE